MGKDIEVQTDPNDPRGTVMQLFAKYHELVRRYRPDEDYLGQRHVQRRLAQVLVQKLKPPNLVERLVAETYKRAPGESVEALFSYLMANTDRMKMYAETYRSAMASADQDPGD